MKVACMNWYKALNLKERLTKLSPSSVSSPYDQATAERRLQQWKNRSTFKDDNFFQQRLEADGLSQELFLYILGEETDDLAKRFSTLNWVTELSEALKQERKQQQEGEPSFLVALSPLLLPRYDAAYTKIKDLKTENPELPFSSESLVEMLFQILSDNLRGRVLPRLLTTRMSEWRSQGRLKGESSEARFSFFIEKISEPEEATALLEEFPVLARQILINADIWLNQSISFVNRFATDWKEIKETFFPTTDTGLINGLKTLGDEHRSGAVLKIDFSNNTQLLYKPKSLGIDVKFQQMLDWFNKKGHKPEFRLSKVINKQQYGWVEFFKHSSCSSMEEIHRFYRRQGANTALLYALAGSDIHFENIIAVGEHPILVDLEMLFRRNLPLNVELDSREVVSKVIENSVLTSGILPGRDYAKKDGYQGIDTSGLGAEPGQLQPIGPVWINPRTDEMKLVYEHREAKDEFNNLPHLNNQPVSAAAFLTDIVEGFKYTYNFISEHKEEILSENGILNSFSQEPVRVVTRGTAVYTRLLLESYHPNLLRNAIARDWLFDYLWLDRKLFPKEVAKWVVDSELDDMYDNLVPHFTTYPNSLDLWNSRKQKLSNCFIETSLEQIHQRIQNFGQEDLDRQCWFIEGSFGGMLKQQRLEKNNHWLEPIPANFKENVSTTNSKKDKLVEAAKAIGDKLNTSAIRHDDYATWVTLSIAENGSFRFDQVETTLYDGTCGIALFLAYLGKLTNNRTYTDLAKSAVKTLSHTPSFQGNRLIGAFNGWGSVIYTFTHLSSLWNDKELLLEAEIILGRLPSLIERDRRFDIISGAAGCILALLNLYKVHPSELVLELALKCGRHLVEHSQSEATGLGWICIEKTRPLSGLSHGAAGIAWALLSLAKITNDRSFQETAEKAIEYERSLFVARVGNWLDLREAEVFGERFTNAWCHGAPGIGLARLATLDIFKDHSVLQEIEVAVKTTLSRGFSVNTSICHGGLGNIDFILQSSKELSIPETSVLETITEALLKTIDNKGIDYLTRSPHGIEFPGLMTGMAGAGYQLMRLAYPEIVPSLLRLSPPVNK